MIIYNVTVSVDSDVEQEWLQWMREEHIPEVMESGCFVIHKMLKLISAQEEGKTYAVQYFSDSMEHLNKYLEKYAPQLKQKTLERYGAKAVAFRSILEEV